MCEEESQIENIRTLYKEAQQDRRQLSQTIVRSIGCAIVVNVGIWAFFLKEYVDTLVLEGPTRRLAWRAWYLFVAAVLCSLVVILWRWYTHFLDNRVANLYPELIDYETRLCPSGGGSAWAHLEQLVFKKHTKVELGDLRNKKVIRNLVDKKRIGWRGHNKINAVAIVCLTLMWANCMVLSADCPDVAGLSFVCLWPLLIAFIWLFGTHAHRNPSELEIQAAIRGDDKKQKMAGTSEPFENVAGGGNDDEGEIETQGN